MVRLLAEGLFFIVAVGGGGSVIFWLMHRSVVKTVPDRCKHKRWLPWRMVKEIPVYLYSEVDEGKGLPDRVDAQMERECASCGIRQIKTVRGIDSPHYK